MLNSIKISLVVAALSLSALGFSQTKAPAKKSTTKKVEGKMACCKKNKSCCDKSAKGTKSKKAAPKKNK